MPVLTAVAPPRTTADYVFDFTTADRRRWHVTVLADAVAYLADDDRLAPDAVVRAMSASAHHLELAALRQIARGRATADRIVLQRADLGG